MLAQDDRWLYVLDAGVPSKKPADHRNGALHVVDVAAATLARTVDVGTAPRGLIWDPPTESAMGVWAAAGVIEHATATSTIAPIRIE